MQGLWVVGVLFGLAFLMIVGLHSVLRELFSRGPYTPYSHLYGDDDADEREDLSAPIDGRDDRGIDVQARRA